ncbi:MAG TPA: hypothetical protein VK465_03490, partial [Fibrobacteria bacterium]|nr:hypothetical protein [Fibrobacteria bacterium]
AFYKGDYITRFNYDGDYIGINNWENLDSYSSVPAYVYYAVSETATHYFIHYGIFHPRDWDAAGRPGEQHENDFEGLSLMVKKDGAFGTLTAMETLAHHQFNQYAAAAGIASGSESLDGEVSLYGGTHPRIFVEAQGHGVYQGLWARRDDICETCTFGSFGRLRGDTFGADKAMMPWAWDDSDDGPVYAGAMLCDPAAFSDTHLDGDGFDAGFSHDYVGHAYRTHTIDVFAILSNANRDLDGNGSDIYLKVTAPGSPEGTGDVMNARAWKQSNAAIGVWYDFALG